LSLLFRIISHHSPDNIGPKLLKAVLSHIVDPLQFIFNLSFANGCVPQSFKIAKVIPLFKKGDIVNHSPINKKSSRLGCIQPICILAPTHGYSPNIGLLLKGRATQLQKSKSKLMYA